MAINFSCEGPLRTVLQKFKKDFLARVDGSDLDLDVRLNVRATGNDDSQEDIENLRSELLSLIEEE